MHKHRWSDVQSCNDVSIHTRQTNAVRRDLMNTLSKIQAQAQADTHRQPHTRKTSKPVSKSHNPEYTGPRDKLRKACTLRVQKRHRLSKDSHNFARNQGHNLRISCSCLSTDQCSHHESTPPRIRRTRFFRSPPPTNDLSAHIQPYRSPVA